MVILLHASVICRLEIGRLLSLNASHIWTGIKALHRLEHRSQRTGEVLVLQFHEQVLNLVGRLPYHILIVVLKQVFVRLQWEARVHLEYFFLNSLQVVIIGQLLVREGILRPQLVPTVILVHLVVTHLSLMEASHVVLLVDLGVWHAGTTGKDGHLVIVSLDSMEVINGVGW